MRAVRGSSDALDEARGDCEILSDVEPARITVARTSTEDVRQRQLVVSLDGRPWATLLFGNSCTRDVEPGRHELRIHNTLVWKTVEVELAPGEHARFRAANRAGWGTYSMLSLLGVGPLYVSVTREQDPDADGPQARA